MRIPDLGTHVGPHTSGTRSRKDHVHAAEVSTYDGLVGAINMSNYVQQA
jgi:hypothetical protein